MAWSILLKNPTLNWWPLGSSQEGFLVSFMSSLFGVTLQLYLLGEEFGAVGVYKFSPLWKWLLWTYFTIEEALTYIEMKYGQG